jgi:LysM repeat protein
MFKKHWLILLIAVLLVVSLPACQRSASTAPATTPTGEGNVPFPTPLPNEAMENAVSGTQTAVAIQKATQNPVLPTNTQAPVVDIPTNTPQPTSTPAPQVVVPTATPGRPASYTLQKGEFPFCIARRFDVDVATLLSSNGLSLNSKPPIGTVLKIPQTGSLSGGDRDLKTHTASYTVQTGDTIYSVACLFGDVDPNAIIAANSLQDPYTLTAGATIQIP